MKAEKNKRLRFSEPYLLALSSNKEGRTGCQFFITLQEMPALDGSGHTIIGRMVQGKDTLNVIEGLEEFRAIKDDIKMRMMSAPGTMGDTLNQPLVEKLKNKKQTKAIERIGKEGGDPDKEEEEVKKVEKVERP